MFLFSLEWNNIKELQGSGLRQSQSLTEFLPHEDILVVCYQENGLTGPWPETAQVSD